MGEDKHDGLAVPGQIVLAHELPFAVGVLKVEPPTRQVEHGERHETLEPRVMQVFVALARAQGRIVTRDELIDWCWGGRIVGEDAINRAISRLRQVAAEIGAGSFGVETITKVGYRIVETKVRPHADRIPTTEATASTRLTRRGVVIAGGAAAVAAAGTGLWWVKPWRHKPDPEAVELVRLGDLAQKAGRPDQTRQAVTYFERAVRIDPKYGPAWGMLAASYTHGLDGFSEAQLASFPARMRSAAARALELDPRNPDALLALACIPPFFRNWLSMERNLRQILEEHPHHWLVNGRLAILYYQVGRLIDGANLHRGVIAREPMLPGPYAFAAGAFSSAGHVQEADALLKEASDRWPANPLIFASRFNHLLSSGRPASAAALLVDPEARPSGLSEAQVQPYVTIARAVEKRTPADVDAAIRFSVGQAHADAAAIADVAPVLALLGRLDLSLASTERYLLNRGSFGSPAPIGPLTRRYTDYLYSTPMAPIRSNPRYRDLTKAVGLDAYWQATGTNPDVA